MTCTTYSMTGDVYDPSIDDRRVAEWEVSIEADGTDREPWLAIDHGTCYWIEAGVHVPMTKDEYLAAVQEMHELS